MKKQLWVSSSSAECAVKSKLPFALFLFPKCGLFILCVCVCGPNPALFQNTNSAMGMRWDERREEEGEGRKSAKKAHSTSIQLLHFFGTLFIFFSSPFSFHCWVVQIYPHPHAMFHSQLVFLFLRSSSSPPTGSSIIIIIIIIIFISFIF